MSTFQKIGFFIAVAITLFLSGKGLVSFFGQPQAITVTADTIPTAQTATPVTRTAPSMMGSQTAPTPMMGTRKTRTS